MTEITLRKLKLIKGLEDLIYDAERRIGSHIAADPEAKRSDPYVQDQIAKITAYTEQLNKLLE